MVSDSRVPRIHRHISIPPFSRVQEHPVFLEVGEGFRDGCPDLCHFVREREGFARDNIQGAPVDEFLDCLFERVPADRFSPVQIDGGVEDIWRRVDTTHERNGCIRVATELPENLVATDI